MAKKPDDLGHQIFKSNNGMFSQLIEDSLYDSKQQQHAAAERSMSKMGTERYSDVASRPSLY